MDLAVAVYTAPYGNISMAENAASRTEIHGSAPDRLRPQPSSGWLLLVGLWLVEAEHHPASDGQGVKRQVEPFAVFVALGGTDLVPGTFGLAFTVLVVAHDIGGVGRLFSCTCVAHGLYSFVVVTLTIEGEGPKA